jgi:hypothetical protein
MMKINLTKKEYRILLELVCTADWVLHAFETEERDETQPHRDLQEKLFSLAKEFGCGDLIVYDRQLGQHFPTATFEEFLQEYIEDYENESFWDELVHRLAMRDLLREVGEDGYAHLDAEERIARLAPHEQKYADEVDAFGLDRIVILEERGFA